MLSLIAFFPERENSQESGSGFGGLPAGLDLSSGNGINSLLSFGGSIMRPCFQSSFACSIRSLRDETKFHHINLSRYINVFAYLDKTFGA